MSVYGSPGVYWDQLMRQGYHHFQINGPSSIQDFKHELAIFLIVSNGKKEPRLKKNIYCPTQAFWKSLQPQTFNVELKTNLEKLWGNLCRKNTQDKSSFSSSSENGLDDNTPCNFAIESNK